MLEMNSRNSGKEMISDEKDKNGNKQEDKK